MNLPDMIQNNVIHRTNININYINMFGYIKLARYVLIGKKNNQYCFIAEDYKNKLINVHSVKLKTISVFIYFFFKLT